MTLEPYLGPYFTMQYSSMKEKTPVCFEKVFTDLESEGLLTGNVNAAFFAKKSVIIERAELEYSHREINAETPDMWLSNAKRLMVELADRFNPAMIAEMRTGYDVSDTSSGSVRTSYASNVRNMQQDTPYGELNADSDYTSSQNYSQRGGADTVDSSEGSDSERVARLREQYESTMNRIVEELNVLFIHTVGLNVVL